MPSVPYKSGSGLAASILRWHGDLPGRTLIPPNETDDKASGNLKTGVRTQTAHQPDTAEEAATNKTYQDGFTTRSSKMEWRWQPQSGT